MITVSALLKHYKRKDVQEAIIACARGREVAVKYNFGFGKRPDVLIYPNDVISLVQKGATSFHVSEEMWSNPLQIDLNMNRKALDDLRDGWDLVLGIDCEFLEFSKITAHYI